ncbi:MAG TPA: HRDC domain-containing protein [Gemmatimonadales bacterium]|nr:HRDC domain-containing protein [Gemmatimonadales bacterium]
MSAAPLPADQSKPRVRLIQTQTDLEKLFERFSGEPLLAVDTEAASFHRFHDRIYLLQLSNRHETAVVDPLAVTSLEPFAAVLRNPDVEIVFHDADYDLRLLRLEYGFTASNLFDTRIAAQLLNEPGVGLAALLEKYFGVQLDKRFQRADWSARPLSREMLEYAAADTHYLPSLRDLLRRRLQDTGRLDWAQEEFELATAARRLPSDADEPGYLRLKGAKAMPGRALAVLRELYDWREQLARRMDKAAFRILNNEPMLFMAKAPPRDMAALKAVRGIGGEQAERRGHEILEAVERGLAVPETQLPRIERIARRPPDAAYEARLDRLKAVRNQTAVRFDLAPGVLCPNGTLEAIARVNPSTLEELSEVSELRRWQLRELGGELLRALTPAPG